MAGSGDGGSASRFDELYAQARQARTDAQQTTARAHVVLRQARDIQESYRQSQARAGEVSQLWLSGRHDMLRYSPSARLQARLASMPVIEQAKGILMAQCGWSAEEAFDALRRASQRSNIRVRDLAAQIVAGTAACRAQTRSAGRATRARAAEPMAVVYEAALRRSSEMTG